MRESRNRFGWGRGAVLLLLGLVGPVVVADETPPPPPILGILGGMGPEATANLYQLIVQLTPAEKDQDHIPTLIYSAPQIPDRTTAIRTGDLSIVPYLVEGVTRLEKAGASFIVIPCNTVHYFYDQMQKAVSIPIIHMIRETAAEVSVRFPSAKRVGLLATSGTIQSGLYEKELKARGFAVVTPDDDIETSLVMRAVYGIKAGQDKKEIEDWLAAAGDHLEKKEVDVIVLGCTEIPLAFNPARSKVPVINATRVLAERAIEAYRKLSVARPPSAPSVSLTSPAGTATSVGTILSCPISRNR